MRKTKYRWPAMTKALEAKYERARKEVPRLWNGIVLGLGEEFLLHWKNQRECHDNRDLEEVWEVWRHLTSGGGARPKTPNDTYRIAMAWLPKLVHRTTSAGEAIRWVQGVLNEDGELSDNGIAIPFFAVSHHGTTRDALEHIAMKRHEEVFDMGSC